MGKHRRKLEVPTKVTIEVVEGNLKKRGRGRPRKTDDDDKEKNVKSAAKHSTKRGRGARSGYYAYRGRKELFDQLETSKQRSLIEEALGGEGKAPTYVPCLNRPKCQESFLRATALLEHLTDCEPVRREELMTLPETKAAVERYESFRGKVEEWRKRRAEKNKSLLHTAMKEGLVLSCIACETAYTTHLGLWNHLESCSGVSVNHQLSVPEAIKQSKETYLSYEGRIQDWRADLETKKQRNILKFLYMEESTAKCLQCEKVLATASGMLTHLQKCSVTEEETQVECGICGELVLEEEMRSHISEAHPDPIEEEASTSGKRRSALLASRAMKYLVEQAVAGMREVKSEENEEQHSTRRPKVPRDLDEDFRVEHETEQEDCESEEDGDGSSKVTTLLFTKLFKDLTPPRRGKRRGRPSIARKNGGQVNSPVRTKPIKVKKSFPASLDSYAARYRNYMEHELTNERLFPSWECSSRDWTPVTLPDSSLKDYLPSLEQSMFVQFGSSDTYGVVSRFQDTAMDQGRALFCGSAVSALAWCPTRSSAEYLAVGVFGDMDLGIRTGKDVIQIWKVDRDFSMCQICYIILHDYGTVLDLEWCPSGIESAETDGKLPRLGCLAAATAGGVVLVYCVPDSEVECEESQRFFRPEPVSVLQSGSELPLISVDWDPFKGHSRIAATSADGVVQTWDLADGGKRRLVLGEGDAVSARWMERNRMVVSFGDRSVGLVDLCSGEWVTREQKPAVYGHGLRTCPSVLRGFLSWSDVVKNGLVWGSVSTWCEDGRNFETRRLSMRHSTSIWDVDLSPWTGLTLAVCNAGLVSVCHLEESSERNRGGHNAIKGARLFQLATERLSPDEAEFEDCFRYEDTTRNYKLCSVQPQSLPERTEDCEQLHVALEYTGTFPVSALFRAAWNTNETASNCFAVAGQAGFVFVIHC